MSSHLQDYLLNGGSLDELEEKYVVKHRRHCRFNNLVLFSYGIGCNFNEPFQAEARGIILNEDNNWKVVSRPFTKFWNVGETKAAEIDWPSVRVVEKLDGSMIQVYMYNGEIQIGTTGTPDANVPVNNWSITFEQLFKDTLAQHNLWIPEMPEGYTLIFELCTVFNRIVVAHPENRVYLLGARQVDSGNWLVEHFSDLAHFPRPREFSFRTIEDILDSMQHFKGIEQEGYVAKDQHGNMVKIKHPEYVTLHHAVTGATLDSLVNIALKGESDEVISYFPDLKKILTNVTERIDRSCEMINLIYDDLYDLPTRKEFALQAIKYRFSNVLFQMKDRKLTSREVLKRERVKNVIDVLELKDVWIGRHEVDSLPEERQVIRS